MKSNELRIGNLVLETGEDYGVVKILQIKEMTEHKIGNMSICYHGVKGGYCTSSLEEDDTEQEAEDYYIQPIPLTEEWLLKFGFAHPLNASWCCKNGLDIDMKKGFDCNIVGFGKVSIDYVHHLQNLYFVLTGEELTIKQ